MKVLKDLDVAGVLSIAGVPVTTGGGDVVGPAGATGDHVAVFNSTTGKLIKDGGAFVTGTWFELDGNSDLEPATVFQSGLYFEVDGNGDAEPVA
jgi:hypothetical protein